MTRSTNDPVTDRRRRLIERLQRQEAFEQVAEEIGQDRSFPIVLRWVAEEALRLQNQQYPDEGSSLNNLGEVESIPQTLATSDGES